jgi:hypothetical protein
MVNVAYIRKQYVLFQGDDLISVPTDAKIITVLLSCVSPSTQLL